jgi:hypothetical protein
LGTLPVLALSGLLFWFSVSCGAALPLGSVASGSRTDPTSTPVGTPVQGGYTTYSNTFDHYSVKYPSDWFISPATAPGHAVSISNRPLEVRYPGRWKLDIYIVANPKRLSAQQLADRTATDNSYAVLSETSVTIGGETGIERRLSRDGSTVVAFWVTHGGQAIMIGATDHPDLQPFVSKIVASMAFTK